jgi:hypothetical protein
MPSPRTQTYSPIAPYVVERRDDGNGYIYYEIWDYRPVSYRRICNIYEQDYGRPGDARRDADMIARALNLLMAKGEER